MVNGQSPATAPQLNSRANDSFEKVWKGQEPCVALQQMCANLLALGCQVSTEPPAHLPQRSNMMMTAEERK